MNIHLYSPKYDKKEQIGKSFVITKHLGYQENFQIKHNFHWEYPSSYLKLSMNESSKYKE